MGRQLIFSSEINPHSFVLLFVSGDSGASWSIRDYKTAQVVSERQGREFHFTLAELLQRVEHRQDAPKVSTKDLAFWFQHIRNANLRFSIPEHRNRLDIVPADARSTASYPLLGEVGLLALAKASKSEDMKRIRTSPNSEDWVTWNMFALLRQTATAAWWPALVSLAKQDKPALQLPDGWEEVPEIILWQRTSSPSAYERASRERMRTSMDVDWQARARSAKPVEGESEIDIILKSSVLTVFIEAKLGSDISGYTTYDPSRNQIARNIDVLLETCEHTQPIFWMLVRDKGPARAYTQLMRAYSEQVEVLAVALPHRSLDRLAFVASNLALIRWCDLLSVACPAPSHDIETMAVHRELELRIR